MGGHEGTRRKAKDRSGDRRDRVIGKAKASPRDAEKNNADRLIGRFGKQGIYLAFAFLCDPSCPLW
jgi:hypothetical protein